MSKSDSVLFTSLDRPQEVLLISPILFYLFYFCAMATARIRMHSGIPHTPWGMQGMWSRSVMTKPHSTVPTVWNTATILDTQTTRWPPDSWARAVDCWFKLPILVRADYTAKGTKTPQNSFCHLWQLLDCLVSSARASLPCPFPFCTLSLAMSNPGNWQQGLAYLPRCMSSGPRRRSFP